MCTSATAALPGTQKWAMFTNWSSSPHQRVGVDTIGRLSAYNAGFPVAKRAQWHRNADYKGLKSGSDKDWTSDTQGVWNTWWTLAIVAQAKACNVGVEIGVNPKVFVLEYQNWSFEVTKSPADFSLKPERQVCRLISPAPKTAVI